MISKAMDWLECLVKTKEKEKEERPMPIYLNHQTAAPNAAYQATAYQNATGGWTTGLATQNTGAGNGIVYYQNQQGLAQQYYALPVPCGAMTSMTFVDGTGSTWVIGIDQAYLAIMQQISNMHAATYGHTTSMVNSFTPVARPIQMMVEGDFSFDEIEKAESLITELECGQQGNDDKGISRQEEVQSATYGN